MDVFLMIRRHQTSFFVDAKESTTVAELKKIIEGIKKVAPDDQRLYNQSDEIEILHDFETLSDRGYTSDTCTAQAPGTIGLACRDASGGFEPVEITPISSPPELPEDRIRWAAILLYHAFYVMRRDPRLHVTMQDLINQFSNALSDLS